MICLICRQTEFVDGFTSITFERNEFKLIINNIPAHVCPNCNEAIVDEDTAIDLLNKAGEIENEGLFDVVHEYEG